MVTSYPETVITAMAGAPTGSLDVLDDPAVGGPFQPTRYPGNEKPRKGPRSMGGISCS